MSQTLPLDSIARPGWSCQDFILFKGLYRTELGIMREGREEVLERFALPRLLARAASRNTTPSGLNLQQSNCNAAKSTEQEGPEEMAGLKEFRELA